jgi:DNA recombination protein RmuC
MDSRAPLNVETHEQLRKTIEERLDILRRENGDKLEEMRCTVDEKLHETLEKRLSNSFQQGQRPARTGVQERGRDAKARC